MEMFKFRNIVPYTHLCKSANVHYSLHRPNGAGFKISGLSSPDFNI